MGPRNQEEKSSSEGLDRELTGAINFAPTVERILYGARTVEKYLAREVERFNARRAASYRTLSGSTGSTPAGASRSSRGTGGDFCDRFRACPALERVANREGGTTVPRRPGCRIRGRQRH
jgi:hypothetical protein